MIRIDLHQPLLSARGPMALEVNLTVRVGAFVAVTGPSGSGKTTLLRLLAGLLRPLRGRIVFGAQQWLDTERRHFLPPQRRRVGMVFQDYALFPNFTVHGNLTYALERGQSRQVVDELIAIMELDEFADRYPATLSGGQQQRVALARALVRRPDLLLLDEPFAALDVELRSKLQQYIRRVHERFQLTTLLVSHHPEDVRRMADRVVRLENGHVTWQGRPDELPSDDRAAALSGRLLRREPAPGGVRLWIQAGPAELAVVVAAELAGGIAEGEELTVEILADRVIVRREGK